MASSGVDFYLDWNTDLLLTPSGGIQTAVGWDRIRQRIIRRAITNPAQQLPTGRFTPADYIFHRTYGLGLGSLVDSPFSDNLIQVLERRVVAACNQDDDIDSANPPQVKFYRPYSFTLWIVVGVTLVTGQQGEIAIKYGPQP